MSDGDGQEFTFRGGVAAGIVTATWPLGRLSGGRDRLRISSPIGFRTVDVRRDQVEEVVIRRNRVLDVRLQVTSFGGVVSKTAFLPTNPGKVAAALEASGWPVRVDLRHPRVPPAAFLICGVALILVAFGDIARKSDQADTINRRSVELTTRIESVESSGGKRYGTVSYSVDSTNYGGQLVLFSSQHLGEELRIRYDPQEPSLFWERGDDPPGTDESLLGLAMVPGLFLIYFWRRQRGLVRYLGGPGR